MIFYDIKKISSNEYANSVSLNEIKLKSDIISIHTDLNQSSLNLVNMDFIKSLEYGKYYSRLELTAAKFDDLEEETNSGH